jgi:hypothetical protein
VNALADTQNASEACTLAREFAAAFRGMVEHYKRECGRSPQEALAAAHEGSPEYEALVLQGAADEVSWHGLEYLASQDPEKALRRWEEVKAEALAELRSGHRAAKTMEGCASDCWRRAQFLAVRRDLTEAWQPRNGLERQLLDMLAQAQTAQLRWLGTLSLRCTTASLRKPPRGTWEPLTVADAEAVEQAAGMVDRFNRIFLRTLRALRDLRRQAPGVVVQSAGQVNVAEQQVNVQSTVA